MSSNTAETIRLNGSDNVVTAKVTIPANTEISKEQVKTLNEIPVGHKVATAKIETGKPVRKYNQIIGFASCDIAPGEHVHTQNVEMKTFDRDYKFGVDAKPTDYVAEAERATCQGIKRSDGSVATRNYLGVMTSVNCSATAARMIADSFTDEVLQDYPNVDGVVAYTHGTGCGMAASGLGWEFLQATINGYKSHPNFAGILMVGPFIPK